MTPRYATFRNILTAHARKRLVRSFRSKIWPCHSLRQSRFPIRRVYSTIWWRLRNIHVFHVFAEFSFDLVTLTFDVLPWRCLMN